MTSAQTQKKNSTIYSDRTIARADRALRCLPFRVALFTTMRFEGVSLAAIAGQRGFDNGYTDRPLLELVADDRLTWLIQVGVLRREVDGQGITDSFRLTPLGRQRIAIAEANGRTFGSPSWLERIAHTLHRWLRLPL
jgi:hypothetical protein